MILSLFVVYSLAVPVPQDATTAAAAADASTAAGWICYFNRF